MDIFDSREISEQSILVKIKTIVNDWSNKVPHHKHKNYGDDINITNVELKPVYYIELTTEYDHRVIEVKNVPYKGEPLPEQLYDYPNEVDIWKYECEEPEDFVNTENVFHVQGSDSVSTCYNCEGHGKLRCPRCDGKKRITCTSCNGTPKRKCSSCGGRGYQIKSCSHCSDGSYYNHSTGQRQSCSYCGGTNRQKDRCFNCSGTGTSTCSTCRGSGKIDCPTCSAKGYIVCSKCEGHGKLRRYYEIIQTLNFEEDTVVHKHADFEEYYSRFTVNLDSDAAELVVNVSDRYYKIDEFDISEQVKASLGELLDNAHNRIIESQDYHQQQILIYKYDVYDVDYEWDGDDHSMLVDATSGMVYDPFGPIYSKMHELNDKAEELATAKKYSKAIQLNSLAMEMDLGGYLNFISDLQDDLGDKIMGSYRIGAWIANIPVIAAIYYLFLQFFNSPHFYLDYFNTVFEQHEYFPQVYAHHMSILFTLAALLILPGRLEETLKGRFGYYISNGFLRGLIGFTGMIFISLYHAVMMIIINWSGLTLITGFASYYVFKIISWITGLIF